MKKVILLDLGFSSNTKSQILWVSHELKIEKNCPKEKIKYMLK